MNNLEIKLDKLNQEVLKMTSLVEKHIDIAVNYYYKENYNDNINDNLVDEFERKIEEMCLDIMIKERPYAKDLRRLTGILTLVEDIERIGDHAEDILNFSKKIDESSSNMKIEIKDLFDIVLKMFRDSIHCFVNMNKELAEEIINMDDIVDNIYETKLNELIKNWKTKNDSSFAIYNTLVVKYLERIADHAVNIAEWVIYIKNGYYKDKQIF